jgi:TM2 domain-containing membrane protein YozV
VRTEFEKYCFSCGSVIDSRALVCPTCNVAQPDVSRNRNFNPRWLVTLLLCWFLGVFGVHRFYLGRLKTGILMLITIGGFGIWYLIDLIMVIIGNMKDENGNYVKSFTE